MVVAVDIALCAVAVLLGIWLRLGALPAPSLKLALVIAVVTVSVIPIFAALGLYRTIVRHSGLATMKTVAQGVLLASIPIVAIVTMMGVPTIPRTVGIIAPILLLLLVIWSRIAARAALTQRRTGTEGRPHATRVVIYGAGSAGRQLSSALGRATGHHVVAYLDDDPTLQGRTLNSIPIFGPERIETLIDDARVTEILLAIPSATRTRRNQIIAELRRFSVHVQTLPALADLARGRVQLTDLRELEVEDLLGREPVAPNEILLGRNIANKVVLVTGAGGSIGSELCRQILAIGPAMLLLLDASEFALYSIHQDLRGRLEEGDATTVVPLLGSVRDEARIDEIIRTWRPHTIYHAAAYKHVPLVEHNVVEGVRNNLWGTLRVATAARRHGVADVVLISTDKAVRPTNVMGTSKRLAEMVLQAFAAEDGDTRFSMVRFGNVLGSSGSVVPLFRRQIAAGGPLTITHPDITRYFMTIPEAAQLVIQAGAMAHGGDVFVLDMGKSVRIVDLARNMIELSGLTVRDEANPGGDIEIAVVGMRPGEKLYEELLIGNDPQKTRHPRILKANEQMLPWPQLSAQLDTLAALLDASDVRGVRALLQQIVPEYRPDADVVDWVEVERRAG